jgi:hypothetical protein
MFCWVKNEYKYSTNLLYKQKNKPVTKPKQEFKKKKKKKSCFILKLQI